MIIGINGYIGTGKDTVAKMIQYLVANTKHPQDKPSLRILLEDEYQQKNAGEIIGWEIKKFAYKLKQMVSLLTGIPVEDLEKESVKSSELGPEWNYILKAIRDNKNRFILIPGPVEPGMEDRAKKLSVRQLLQWLGTEACRNNIHENCWVNALFSDYKMNRGLDGDHIGGRRPSTATYPNWVISDLRFPNEAQAIKDRGGLVVRINRPVNTGSKVINRLREEGIKHSSETALDGYSFDYTIDNSGSLEDLLEQVRTMLLHFKIIT